MNRRIDVNKMARNHHQEIEKEIRRIEGQLLVAKQICRENVFINLLNFNINIFFCVAQRNKSFKKTTRK